jgi:hypothetical protein
MIDNIDRNTIPHIMFLTIHLDSITINDDIEESIANEAAVPVIDENLFIAGDTVTIETNFSFIRFDTDVQVISQSENEVEFVVPYNVSELTITTKNINGDLVVITYEVA